MAILALYVQLYSRIRTDRTQMNQNDDPKKRPLLTAAQLDRMTRPAPRKIKKGTPREEFERLFTATRA